jgi:2,3-bisphosphoglycerate-dependent phosphoglycerate mutase
VDVPLTDNGINEALKAGKRIADVPVDVIYVSDLMRAQMTAMIAMTQHNRGKVPIVQHESPELSSKIFSEKTETDCIPVYKAWELNERMYGELQGLNKAETAEKYGDDQVKVWRRSYDIPPPDGESLEMTAERAVKYFKETIVPHLERGESVLVSAHGNSLRAIIMYIENLSPDEVVLLELFTGIPLVYEMQEEGLKRMGTPQTDCAPGVYAISEGLAKYKDSLAALNDPLYSS